MDAFLSLADVIRLTRYSRTSIYRMERAHKFPSRVRLGPKKVVWVASEVEDWMNKQPRGMASGWKLFTQGR